VFYGAVGVQEFSGEVNDGVAVPVHAQAGFCLDDCYNGSLQIFSAGFLDELLGILRRNDNCHTLLGLTDGDFGAVQTVVFLGHGVQVDF